MLTLFSPSTVQPACTEDHEFKQPERPLQARHDARLSPVGEPELGAPQAEGHVRGTYVDHVYPCERQRACPLCRQIVLVGWCVEPGPTSTYWFRARVRAIVYDSTLTCCLGPSTTPSLGIPGTSTPFGVMGMQKITVLTCISLSTRTATAILAPALATAATKPGGRPTLTAPVSVPFHERLRGGTVRLLLSLQLRRLQQGP